MSVTQELTPTQLTVGTGVGTGELMVVEDAFLVLDECLVVFDGNGVVVESNLVEVVERGLVVVEGGFAVVDRRVVDRGEEGAGCDPPVIRFLIARS